RTILCVSHDLRFTKKFADVVCVMYSGKTVEIAEAASFFEHPRHPYSQMLLGALPENGLKCPKGYAPSVLERGGCDFAHLCENASEQCAKAPEMVSAQ
ncbi:MAG: ABC transporter ATP-binding protein, partial [Eubacterium sp.]